MRPTAPLFGLLAVALGGCSAGAPVSDGSFVTYEISGTRVRVSFEDAGGGDYRTVGQVIEEGGAAEPADGMPGHGETVDSKLRTDAGGPLEVASFGPIWAPTGDLREGGRVYGSAVSELRVEQGREVAVVQAVAGGAGALRGAWVYDTATGFLVSGSMGTAFSGADGGQRFRLVETNVPGLVVP